MNGKELKVGDTVWAKLKGFCPWPALVCVPHGKMSPKSKKPQHLVFFLGTHDFARVLDKDIFLNTDERLQSSKLSPKKSSSWSLAIEEIQNSQLQAKLRTTIAWKLKQQEHCKKPIKIERESIKKAKKMNRKIEIGMKKIGTMKIETKEIETKEIEPKEIEPKENEPKKNEPKKNEPKKIEPMEIDMKKMNDKIQKKHNKNTKICLKKQASSSIKTTSVLEHNEIVMNHSQPVMKKLCLSLYTLMKKMIRPLGTATLEYLPTNLYSKVTRLHMSLNAMQQQFSFNSLPSKGKQLFLKCLAKLKTQRRREQMQEPALKIDFV